VVAVLEATVSDVFLPPWRDVLPNGKLGEPYGPSPATFAKQVREQKDWSFKKQGTHRDHAPLLREFMAANTGTVSEQEQEAYRYVYEQGLGTVSAAEDMGVSRSSVRTYLARLEVKARCWKGQR
jgi:predicted DNA-binding protein (UPF0251 family)